MYGQIMKEWSYTERTVQLHLLNFTSDIKGMINGSVVVGWVSTELIQWRKQGKILIKSDTLISKKSIIGKQKGHVADMPLLFCQPPERKEVMMLTKEKITEILKEKYPYLVSEYGVKRIGLFGSYAKGKQTENSDIDIVAEFESSIGIRFVEFAECLEDC